MVANRFPGMRVDQVHLDDRVVVGFQRIVQGQGGVRVRSGVDDRADRGVPGGVDGVGVPGCSAPGPSLPPGLFPPPGLSPLPVLPLPSADAANERREWFFL